MENQKSTTTNYQLYCLDKQYKAYTNLIEHIDQAQNFYNGNQYPNNNFNNMIRVSANICSFSATIKASKICGTPIYLAFTADNLETDCTKLRQFDEYNCNKVNLKTSNYQAALNGFVNGTEITYIPWDKDDTSYKGIYKGGLVEEHIDLRNFAVANPYIQNIQNQEWVMFWEDYSVKALKDMVEGKSKKEIEEKKSLIEREVSDESGYKNKDSINHALCTMWTRFFRVEGEVYFMCSTEKVDLFQYPHPLSKKLGKKIIEKVVDDYIKSTKENVYDESGNIIKDYNIDYEDLIMSSSSKEIFNEDEYIKEKEKFSLYPFAVFRPFSVNRSFYGRSDVASIIPIQKAINFAISMNLMCAQNNAYNKIWVKEDTLQGQVITNEPSQVLVDHSNFTNGWGIKMAESQPMPNGLLNFANELLGMTRVIYGFNDVMDGSVSNQDMSGYMLQQMIKQSNTSIEQQQQLFWTYNEEKAAIRLMYYKHYVDKAKYAYEMEESEYEGEEQARQQMYNALLNGSKLPAYPNAKPEDFKNPTHKRKTSEITNEELWGVNFDICVDSMQGLSDSKLVEQQMWDNLLLNGGINNISPDVLEMYLSASPNVSPRTKSALKRIVENIKKSNLEQLKAKYSDLMQKTQQIMQYAKQLENANKYQGSYLKNLENEFKTKIDGQNGIINSLVKDLDSYRTSGNQMSEGEVKSNNSKGVKGGSATTSEQPL